MPSGGFIHFNEDSTELILDSDAIYYPVTCPNEAQVDVTIAAETDPKTSEAPRDPFVASTLPVIYALAATTLTAWMLVIMLFITPRTYVSGGTVVLGRRGFASGTSGSEAGIGIGGRSWLQKVAALFVAVALTIATSSTFSIAARQYDEGIMDARVLQEEVLGGHELKIIMTVSDAFLWLAQAQTLIRLFPRHREKVIIKWTALALISLSLLFNILNDFYYMSSHRPVHFVEAVPALSYLFQLALGLLYCAWVLYYAMTKKRYAFYHPRMRNMCLLALISVVSILVPVVFFVVDISKPSVAGWGDYVRWVGACAASVVVWEWVERIEALERDDKRDGVLGREIFDGDEMLDITPSTVVTEKGKESDSNSSRGKSSGAGGLWPGMHGRAQGARKRDDSRRQRRSTEDIGRPQEPHAPTVSLPLPQWPTRPPPAVTPVSRTDTASAESTVYAVRYHPIGEAAETIPEHVSRTVSRASSGASRMSRDVFDVEAQVDDNHSSESRETPFSINKDASSPEPHASAKQKTSIWDSISWLNPFSKNRQRPPPEIAAAGNLVRRISFGRDDTGEKSWDLVGRVEEFAVAQAEKIRAKTKSKDTTPALPVTRIPAPPRRRTVAEMQVEIRAEAEVEARRPAQLVGSSPPRVWSSREDLGEQGAREQRRPILRQTNTEPLAYRGALSFAPVAHEHWGVQEHNAIGTASLSLSSTADAPPTSSGGTGVSSVVRPLTLTETPEQRVGEGVEQAPPRLQRTNTADAPGLGGLPVVRVPAPPRIQRPPSPEGGSNNHRY